MRGPKRGPSPLTRPRRRSIASRRSSSSRGAQRRVSSAAPLRKRGWSLVPDGVGLAQGRDGDDARPRPRPRAARARARSGPWIAKVRAQPDEASGHGRDCPSSVASRSYRVTRRAPQRTIGVIALCFSSAAQAALLAHPGEPVTSDRSPPGLQAYPRTLVELDRVRGGQAAPAAAPRRRRADLAGARALAAAELGRAAPAARAQRARGSSARCTPDVPIGSDPRGASGFLGQFTDPLSPTEWWLASHRRRPTGSRRRARGAR